MALALDLDRVLLHILPMPAMMAQGRLLGMPNHMEMIRGRLWAINGTILDAQLRALKEPELEERVTYVGAAIVDVVDLLGRILDWHPRGELKEMARRLNYLVRRGSLLGLSKEIMESVDPRQEEEYSAVLREEVVGRNEDVEKIINVLQQQQSGDRDEWLLIDGGDGRTTFARLIYHHSWVHDHFQHRIWVDVPNIASLDPMWIMREFTRSITGEACEDIWLESMEANTSSFWMISTSRRRTRMSGSNRRTFYCSSAHRGVPRWSFLTCILVSINWGPPSERIPWDTLPRMIGSTCA
ncbi:resistance protein [Musa troglodytarum]|uniref:Resistance protein n=1 Tax=Musa troglodytarum TaxID=320322 RepID=A0A9E7E840_9LILI|nr:resistance protein [Musa troglodytarum]